MNALLLMIIMASGVLQTIAKKQYVKKVGNTGVFIFNAATTLCSAVFFLCTDSDGFQFTPALLPYVLGFAVCFGGSVLFNLLAIREGPLSLTALATNYSLLIPTFYGLLFLREQASWQLYAGLICLAASLFLVSRKNVKFTITVKWLIFALLTFLCNGFGSVMQTVQQNRFDGQYKNEFNILMLALLFILFLTISLIVERKQIAACVKVGAPFMALKGIGNGAVNLLILVVLSRGVPASIAFPLVSGGGIVLSTLLSIFVYREKLSVQQYIGLALGVVSVVLMKI